MSQTINLLHVHVLSQMLHESRTLEQLRDAGASIATLSMNETTKAIIRQLYKSRQEELESHGGDDRNKFENWEVG